MNTQKINEISKKLLDLEIYPNEIRYRFYKRGNKPGRWNFEIKAKNGRKKEIKRLLKKNKIVLI